MASARGEIAPVRNPTSPYPYPAFIPPFAIALQPSISAQPQPDPSLLIRLAIPHRQCQLAEVNAMLWTLFVILLVLWLLGMVSSYTFGGFIHILLVLALVALVFQLVSGRRTSL
jgi:hypothetical protein